MGWETRVKDLLYGSESIEKIANIDDAGVVVTSHRVMTFTPNMDGENFRYVDRPNVTGVKKGAISRTGLAERSVRYGIYSVLLLLAGAFINFDSFIGDIQFDSEATQQTGAGGIVGIAQGMINFFSQLDDLMRLIGALGLLVAVAIFAVYWLLRTPTLVITVAGDTEDMHVPRPDEPDAVTTALEEAILGESDDSGKLASVVPEDIF